jgi:hypothetical protein
MQGEEGLGPRVSKDEFTNKVIDLTKPSRGATQRCATRGTKEPQMISQVQWAKSAIGFKDDKMIIGHEAIKQATTC